jgi:hypothetical protein
MCSTRASRFWWWFRDILAFPWDWLRAWRLVAAAREPSVVLASPLPRPRSERDGTVPPAGPPKPAPCWCRITRRPTEHRPPWQTAPVPVVTGQDPRGWE